MKLYFSGNTGSLPREQRVFKIAQFPHRCLSYAYLGARRSDQLKAFEWFQALAKAKHPSPAVFLDSGAFTLQSDKACDLKIATAFARTYQAFVEANPTEHYVSVDWRRDGAVSMDMLKRMEGWGMQPLPVWHAETDFMWFEKLCAMGYKLICVSKPDHAGQLELDRLYKQVFRVATDAKVQIHGLSETGQNVLKYPFYSADSTSWLQDAGRGDIVVVDNERQKLKRCYIGGTNDRKYSWNTLPPESQKYVETLVKASGLQIKNLQEDYTWRAAYNAWAFLRAIEQKPITEDRFSWRRVI